MTTQERIDDFLAEGPWAVAGASTNREKYGNKVLRTYLQHGLEVYAVNPRADEIAFWVPGATPDRKGKPIGFAPWEDVMRALDRDGLVERQDVYPERFRVCAYPDDATLRSLGLDV